MDKHKYIFIAIKNWSDKIKTVQLIINGPDLGVQVYLPTLILLFLHQTRQEMAKRITVALGSMKPVWNAFFLAILDYMWAWKMAL